jgi:hypothetical protein
VTDQYVASSARTEAKRPVLGFWLVVAGWALLLIAAITRGL